MRILFDLAAIVLNSTCMASYADVALMFAEAFRFQAGIVHG
jgi:hypothetical protein